MTRATHIRKCVRTRIRIYSIRIRTAFMREHAHNMNNSPSAKCTFDVCGGVYVGSGERM